LDVNRPSEVRKLLNALIFEAITHLEKVALPVSRYILHLLEEKKSETTRWPTVMKYEDFKTTHVIPGLQNFMKRILRSTETEDLIIAEQISDIALKRLEKLGEIMVVQPSESTADAWVLSDKEWLTKQVLGNIVLKCHIHGNRSGNSGLLSTEMIDEYSGHASRKFNGDKNMLPIFLSTIGACVPLDLMNAGAASDVWFPMFVSVRRNPTEDCKLMGITSEGTNDAWNRVIIRKFVLSDNVRQMIPRGYLPTLFSKVAGMEKDGLVESAKIKIFEDGFCIQRNVMTENQTNIEVQIVITAAVEEGEITVAVSTIVHSEHPEATPTYAYKRFCAIRDLLIAPALSEDSLAESNDNWLHNLHLIEILVDPKTQNTRENRFGGTLTDCVDRHGLIALFYGRDGKGSPFDEDKAVVSTTRIPRHDVFISYRDASEKELAQRFHDRLTSDGWNVWFDKKCIGPTVNWRTAFMTGVMRSAMIVTILSKGAINHTCNSATPTETEIRNMKKRSYPELRADSPCDNVLLEHRLAGEFALRNWCKIYPVMVGKKQASGVYTDYFRDGSHPRSTEMTSTVVEAVEKELNHFFAFHRLEVLEPNKTVEKILQEITDCNGKKIEGDYDVAFEAAIKEINEVLKAAGRTPTPP